MVRIYTSFYNILPRTKEVKMLQYVAALVIKLDSEANSISVVTTILVCAIRRPYTNKEGIGVITGLAYLSDCVRS
jgi:hypothetical protein